MCLALLTIYLVVLRVFVVDNYINCIPTIDQELFICYDDIAEATNYLYEHLPRQMTLDQKCIRYCVMTSMTKPRGRLHKKAVLQVLDMSEDELIRLYEGMKVKDELGAHYMTAIDGFRAASMLGPPFLELIECIKRIDSPAVHRYLEGEELNTILTLYKQVLESPDTKISLGDFPNWSRFRRAFVRSLIHLFRDDLKFDWAIYQTLGSTEAADLVRANSSKQPESLDGPSIGSKRRPRRQERRRLAAHRHREQERLRKQRLKILDPSLESEKARYRQQQRIITLRKEAEQRAIPKRQRFATKPKLISPKPTLPYNLAIFQHNPPMTQMTQIPQIQQIPQLQPQQQQPQPRLHSKQQGTEQRSPELVEHWSEVAHIYESIPTPIMYSSRDQQQSEQVPTSLELEPRISGTLSSHLSHQHRYGRRLRHLEEEEEEEQRRKKRLRLSRLDRVPLDLSTTEPNVQQLILDEPVSPSDKHTSFRPLGLIKPIESQPLVEPTPLPRPSNQTASQGASSTPLHCDFGFQDTTMCNNPMDNDSNAQGLFHDSMVALHGDQLDPIHRSNEGDAFMQSLWATPEPGIGDDLDQWDEDYLRPEYDFDRVKECDR